MLRLPGLSFGIIAAALGLSACGGGGGSTSGGGDPEPVILTVPPQGSLSDSTLFSGPDGQTQTLSVVSLNGNTGATSRQFGTLRLPGTITGSTIAGVISDSDSGTLDLAAGGEGILLNQIDSDHALIFRHDAIQGVAGEATPAGGLPGSNVTYNGAGLVQVIGDGVVYTLNGDARIRANFAAGTASVAFNRLEGGEQTGGAITAISGLDIDITDVTISGTRLTGGTLTLESSLPQPDAGGTLTHAGQFYGPTAEEVGGVFDFEDTTGPVRALGTYIAK